jgi:hypothetical protein
LECQEEEVGLDMAVMVAGEEESVGVEVGAEAWVWAGVEVIPIPSAATSHGYPGDGGHRPTQLRMCQKFHMAPIQPPTGQVHHTILDTGAILGRELREEAQ